MHHSYSQHIFWYILLYLKNRKLDDLILQRLLYFAFHIYQRSLTFAGKYFSLLFVWLFNCRHLIKTVICHVKFLHLAFSMNKLFSKLHLGKASYTLQTYT